MRANYAFYSFVFLLLMFTLPAWSAKSISEDETRILFKEYQAERDLILANFRLNRDAKLRDRWNKEDSTEAKKRSMLGELERQISNGMIPNEAILQVKHRAIFQQINVELDDIDSAWYTERKVLNMKRDADIEALQNRLWMRLQSFFDQNEFVKKEREEIREVLNGGGEHLVWYRAAQEAMWKIYEQKMEAAADADLAVKGVIIQKEDGDPATTLLIDAELDALLLDVRSSSREMTRELYSALVWGRGLNGRTTKFFP